MKSPSGSQKFRLVAILVIIVLLLMIIWQNSAATTLSLLFVSAELPLMLWLALFLGIGILLGVSLMWIYRGRS